MKRVIFTLVAFSAVSMVAAEGLKVYNVKSAKLEYSIKGSGNVMGIKSKTLGKKRLVFANYGAQSLNEEFKVTKQSGMGQNSKEKIHNLVYMKDGIMYSVDFKQKRVLRMQNAGAMMGAIAGGKNLAKAGEKMLKQMGAKKSGQDKVLGYTCDVWELMGTKQCIYKGVPLRVESNIMGIKSVEVATKAEFDVDISSSDFKLPNFPVYDMSGKKLDSVNLDAVDKSAAKEAKKMQEAMQKYKDSADKTGAKNPQDALESVALNMMKQKIVAKEGEIKEIRACLSDANNLSDVKACEKKLDKDGDFGEDMPTKWDDKIKARTLKEIDSALESINCIKGAKSMQDIQVCSQR